MKKEHPDKKVTELTKILAEEFKNIDPEQKKNYEADYHKKMEHWRKEMEAYKEKYGDQLELEEKKKVSAKDDKDLEKQMKK